jgi:hypothetical protein
MTTVFSARDILKSADGAALSARNADAIKLWIEGFTPTGRNQPRLTDICRFRVYAVDRLNHVLGEAVL